MIAPFGGADDKRRRTRQFGLGEQMLFPGVEGLRDAGHRGTGVAIAPVAEIAAKHSAAQTLRRAFQPLASGGNGFVRLGIIVGVVPL